MATKVVLNTTQEGCFYFLFILLFARMVEQVALGQGGMRLFGARAP